ncbi:MAG: amidohydrolase family protein [Deltaproteobacteria bacterium]|nr:amidohydrolase family protein [Deltaproteobacteria bacterium]
MIIDVHSHLGDILYPEGGQLIFKKGIKKQRGFDIIGIAELSLYKTNPLSEWLLKKFCSNLITKAGRARNAAGTLENMQLSMTAAGVIKTACMPIVPYLTFEDLRKAQAVDPGIIPFTGIDFTRTDDAENQLKSDVAQGARGLKLHPNIQKEPLDSQRTFTVVENFSQFNLPVLFHSGVTSYYLGPESEKFEIPSYGETAYARKLVSAFPNVPFIVGHAGIFQYKETIGLLSGFKNTYVDTSFQPPNRIRELIQAFGPERVLYASDWPWGDRRASVSAVRKACRGDRSLEKLIYSENAARLLGLTS